MDLSRRTLLQTATMASLTIPAVAATQTGNSVAIRDQILLAPDILYFNAAKIGPAFHSAITAQQRGTAEFQTVLHRSRRHRGPPLRHRHRRTAGPAIVGHRSYPQPPPQRHRSPSAADNAPARRQTR